jgi:hypothetical protein
MEILDYIENNTNIIIMILVIIALITLLLQVINSFRIRKWKNKYYNFVKSNDDFNIEDVLNENIKNIEMLRELYYKQTLDINNIKQHVRISFQKHALLKYNAFQEMGGELSFVLVLLNQNNTGVLLNGVHSREGCYMYIKEVNEGKCDKTLSNEEKNTLQKAVKS